MHPFDFADEHTQRNSPTALLYMATVHASHIRGVLEIVRALFDSDAAIEVGDNGWIRPSVQRQECIIPGQSRCPSSSQIFAALQVVAKHRSDVQILDPDAVRMSLQELRSNRNVSETLRLEDVVVTPILLISLVLQKNQWTLIVADLKVDRLICFNSLLDTGLGDFVRQSDRILLLGLGLEETTLKDATMIRPALERFSPADSSYLIVLYGSFYLQEQQSVDRASSLAVQAWGLPVQCCLA